MSLLVLLAIAFSAWQEFGPGPGFGGSPSDADAVLATAFESRQSNLQVRGQGEVVRILADDRNGSRHQRFVLRLDSGQTILVAHNIDLAPRVAGLAHGDAVAFHGEYEWNSKGGVIHWTHDDPDGRHVAGWLKHNGRTYQQNCPAFGRQARASMACVHMPVHCVWFGSDGVPGKWSEEPR